MGEATVRHFEGGRYPDIVRHIATKYEDWGESAWTQRGSKYEKVRLKKLTDLWANPLDQEKCHEHPLASL